MSELVQLMEGFELEPSKAEIRESPKRYVMRGKRLRK
jgi:hypothetical protein